MKKEVRNVEYMMGGGYVSPESCVVSLSPEGILCSSGITEQFEDGEFDWN